MHPNVHCSTIYKNQDMEATQIVIKKEWELQLMQLPFLKGKDNAKRKEEKIKPCSDEAVYPAIYHDAAGAFLSAGQQLHSHDRHYRSLQKIQCQ